MVIVDVFAQSEEAPDRVVQDFIGGAQRLNTC